MRLMPVTCLDEKTISSGGEYTAEILTMVSWKYNTLNYK